MSFLDDLGGYLQQGVAVANSASQIVNTLSGQTPPGVHQTVQTSPQPAVQGPVVVAPASPAAPAAVVSTGISGTTIAILAGAGVFGLLAVGLIARR